MDRIAFITFGGKIPMTKPELNPNCFLQPIDGITMDYVLNPDIENFRRDQNYD